VIAAVDPYPLRRRRQQTVILFDFLTAGETIASADYFGDGNGKGAQIDVSRMRSPDEYEAGKARGTLCRNL
jgi:hypothetical protein